MEDFAQLAAGAAVLRVDIRKGDLVVRAMPDAAWAIEWSSREGTSDEPVVERDGATLWVRQPHGHPHHRRLDVRLTIPTGVEEVNLHNGSGRIDALGLRGRLRLKCGNGALTLRESAGDLQAHGGNGAIEIEGFEGVLNASSGNGRVRLSGSRGEATLHSGNGNVEVTDAEGQMRATTGNGSISLTEVGGVAEANSGHGSVSIDAPRGLAARVTTAMGSIHVSRGALGPSRLTSSMGSVDCRATLLPGAYTLESGMGSVVLTLPAQARARIDAQTSFGRVRSDFPLVQVGRSGPMSFGGMRMVGGIGEGAPEVEATLRSDKGGVNLRRGAVDDTASFSMNEPGMGFSTMETAMGEAGWAAAAAIGMRDIADIAASAASAASAATSAVSAVKTAFAGSTPSRPAYPSRPPAPPTPPSPTSPPSPATPTPPRGSAMPMSMPTPDGETDSTARLAVLEALARGEISVDEAETLLSRQG